MADGSRGEGPAAVVGVITDRRVEDGVALDTVRARHGEALHHVDLAAVYLPAGQGAASISAALARLDGLVLTGASSNVAPARYGAPEARFPQDPARDATVFAAIATARALGLPILGICRGHQELNVAFGGTLHPSLAATGRHARHTEDLALPRDDQYRPVQPVRLAPDGLLARWFGTDQLIVNTLHDQAIDRLGEGLVPEAIAEDGVIEAVSAPLEPSLVIGVQWHPEWHFATDPVSRTIYSRFAEAARARARMKAVA